MEKEKKKKVKQICKNCLLFDPSQNLCTVNIIIEGEYYQLETNPEDRCRLLEAEENLSMITGEQTFIPIDEIQMKYDFENKKTKISSPD